MTPLMAVLTALSATAAPPVEEAKPFQVEYTFARVAPANDKRGRSRGQARAIILIHGLNLFAKNEERYSGIPLRSWQEPGSALVRRLADDADVYSLAYAQSAAVEKIHAGVNLLGHVRELKKLGYKEIILVGHSAGGLIARHFVEDHPDAGVTRVVQVCAPNTGTILARLNLGREATQAFIASMSRTSRLAVLKKREKVRIPKGVQFACIVVSYRLGGDGVVSCSSQWSEDLQSQNVPAYVIKAAHWDAVKSVDAAKAVSRIVIESHPRWSDEEVKRAKKKILGG
jgi:pimeloyl-ACP methyl ester carboxylesterase